MASAPETVNLQTQDYPPEDKPLLDKLLPVLQRQFDATRVNMAGGLTRANSAGQDLKVNISTPATDWINAQLTAVFSTLGPPPICTTAGSSAIDANANGFAAPRYRYVAGGLFFDGACEFTITGTNTVGTGTVTVPWDFITGIPVPTGAPSSPTPGANVDVAGNWVEVGNGTFHNQTFSGAALIRWTPAAGKLTLRSGGSGAPASPWGIPFLSTTCFFAFPGLVVPPLSVFPITVQTMVQTPTRVTVSYIRDVSTPVTNITYVSPGGIYWDNAAPGSFIIKNIAGLALGRQYEVGLFVEP